ncbi:MAG: hypothetical protein CVV49_16375 [Spirochaetae bacterium HGW-Spirochaetae-5]|nr:MAG: hypothetical protein CVV49_16375 [Spirochaetae bacterium HGW-Spirochaetae-5]
MRLKMKFNMKKVYAVMMLMMLVSVLSVSCGKGKSASAFISFYSGTATIQTANAQPRPVAVQDMVKDGDVIETGDKSSVIVQVGDELLVRFEANTKVVVTSITDIAKREINLEKGKVLSSVAKLKKGSEYSVKTPTAVASVRGTEFLTDFDNGKTIVAVGKGSVSVVKTETKEEKLVDLGNSVVVTEKIEMRGINQVETLELKKLEKTPVIKDLEKMTPEDLKKNYEETIKTDEEINDEIEKLSGMTYEEMKA